MIYFLLGFTGIITLSAMGLCGFVVVTVIRHQKELLDDMTRKLMTQIPGVVGNAQELQAVRETRTKRADAKINRGPQPAPQASAEKMREMMPAMVPPPPSPLLGDEDAPDQIYPSSGSGIR